MRRTQLLVIIPLLMLSLAAAQSSAPQAPAAAAEHPLIQKVDVLKSGDGISVELTGSAQLTATAMMVPNPDRVVVDVPGGVVPHFRHIAVGADGIKAVRLGQKSANPPVARLVVDLAAARDYQLVRAGNRVVLKLRPAGALLARTASVPKPAVVPAVQPIRAAAKAPTAPVAPPAAANAEAKNFVMVEPQYSSRPADSIQPPQRALQAAATMASSLPNSLLMPRESAAMDSSAQSQPSQPAAAQASAAPAAAPAATAAAPAAQDPAPQAPAAIAIKPAENLAAEQQKQFAKGIQPSGKGHYTGEPISVNLKDVDLKDFFRLIHEISGLNIVLDPEVHGSLTIVLDDVPWDQALDIVLKNNGLDRQLEGNVLRIATIDTLRKEAEARRAQIEAEALAVDKVTVTRYLSYAHSKDVVPTLKKLLSSRGDIISDDRTNAVIIQDIPSVIPQVDRLITQLDRKTQEVEIEARVVAATRTFARDLGTQFAFGWGNSATAAGGTGAVGSSPSQVGYLAPPPYFTIPGVPLPTSTPKATAAAIPLFSNLAAGSPTSGFGITNLGSNYRLDFVLTMAESRGLLKILSRPRVVTQNNIQAVVRQGFRIPIVTQAQLGGPPTTTYVDAFLRLTVTPQITAENTIFLNVDVENTTPDFSRTVQGNPTLITQQATTQVLVTDGGTVVIGGVIQTQNSLNVSQVPLLGNIPVFGNLFKHTKVDTSTQELIFFITPKIMQT
ncbi:MAG TPA: type IV pilus secretin PilQ [Terriglobales bacterium]|nr:type IV pilus secretin PilQ [Terriglobales bacterium]